MQEDAHCPFSCLYKSPAVGRTRRAHVSQTVLTSAGGGGKAEPAPGWIDHLTPEAAAMLHALRRLSGAILAQPQLEQHQQELAGSFSPEALLALGESPQQVNIKLYAPWSTVCHNCAQQGGHLRMHGYTMTLGISRHGNIDFQGVKAINQGFEDCCGNNLLFAAASLHGQEVFTQRHVVTTRLLMTRC